jgi:radical SAM superfamily enzyme YgiQ (UPF0313 family)
LDKTSQERKLACFPARILLHFCFSGFNNMNELKHDRQMKKKRILLIQPENREINAFRRRQFNNFAQITIPYLAAFIDETKYEITLKDEYNQAIPYHQTFDLAAITVNTPNAPHCYDIARRFRENGARVVMGGPHVSLLPEEAEQHCDYLLTGECEETWPLFLDHFYEETAMKRYDSASPPSLEHLPKPRWDLLKRRTRMMKAAVFATRGCPYHCRYCNLKQIYHDCFRTRPVEEVIDEIKAICSRFFVFWDDNFFANRTYALSLMNALKPVKKKWAAQVTLTDCRDENILKAAREAGCLYLFIGLESFFQSSLKDAGKEINQVDDYGKIIGQIHKHGLMIQAGIIFGFDSDMPDVFEKTLRKCEETGIDGATVSLLTPLPGTPLYAELKAANRLTTASWDKYNGKTQVVFEPRNMTTEQLLRGYMLFRRKFYSLRSFIRRMKVSHTSPVYNFVVNLGYWLAGR